MHSAGEGHSSTGSPSRGARLNNKPMSGRRSPATSSVKVVTPLVQQIVAQSHQMPDDSLAKPLQQAVTSERATVLMTMQSISDK